MTAAPQDVADERRLLAALLPGTDPWRLAEARGIERVLRFVVGLGASARIDEARNVIDRFGAKAPFEVAS